MNQNRVKGKFSSRFLANPIERDNSIHAATKLSPQGPIKIVLSLPVFFSTEFIILKQKISASQ